MMTVRKRLDKTLPGSQPAKIEYESEAGGVEYSIDTDTRMDQQSGPAM